MFSPEIHNDCEMVILKDFLNIQIQCYSKEISNIVVQQKRSDTREIQHADTMIQCNNKDLHRYNVTANICNDTIIVKKC